jgi:hypothetical protein
MNINDPNRPPLGQAFFFCVAQLLTVPSLLPPPAPLVVRARPGTRHVVTVPLGQRFLGNTTSLT